MTLGEVRLPLFGEARRSELRCVKVRSGQAVREWSGPARCGRVLNG